MQPKKKKNVRILGDKNIRKCIENAGYDCLEVAALNEFAKIYIGIRIRNARSVYTIVFLTRTAQGGDSTPLGCFLDSSKKTRDIKAKRSVP